MLHKYVIISLVISGLLTDTEPQGRDDVRLCLLQAMFYYPPSGECHEPLEQGPCDQAQWLVPTVQDKMVLECQQRPLTRSPETFILSSDGSVVGDHEDDGYKMFDIGDCETRTDRMLPEDFVLHSKPCPRHHKCTSDIEVAYEVLEAIEPTNEYEYALTQDFFKSMICSREPQKRALCLPRDKTNPVTEENLFNSLQVPDLICTKNPCPLGKKPYQAEKGYFRCNGVLGLNSVTSGITNLCPKKKIFRRGKCVSKFFGR